MSAPAEPVEALVVGAGPAGLMAAEVLADAGRQVVLCEAMPTPARKLLMAGKSGLNLTKDEEPDLFSGRIVLGPAGQRRDDEYLGPEEWRGILHRFGPHEVAAWAAGLGIDTFRGTTGRVFPRAMKASPLLRAWLARLSTRGVVLRTRWRWQGFSGRSLAFATPQGERRAMPQVTVLALGGASWPRLGADAAWCPWLAAAGVEIASFRPANMGFLVDWSAAMAPHFGMAVKGTRISAGAATSRGEWVLTRAGIEGGGVYEVSAALREGAVGIVDLAPDLDTAALAARMGRVPRKASIGNRLRHMLRDPVKVALLLEWGRPWPGDEAGWAARAKGLPLRHQGPAGIERAISSAGGIRASALTPELELRALPGIFCAGEMLDWEAPTGGYLLTACLATGHHAGMATARRLSDNRRN